MWCAQLGVLLSYACEQSDRTEGRQTTSNGQCADAVECWWGGSDRSLRQARAGPARNARSQTGALDAPLACARVATPR